MFGNHYYHQTIRRAIIVFGTMFNDVSVLKRSSDGTSYEQQKVPLTFSPRKKVLERAMKEPDLHDHSGAAVVLPRMSFEMVSMTYDPERALSRHNRMIHSVVNPDDPMTKYAKTTRPFASYRLGLQLNAISNNSDDVMQIVEQIVPYFQPDFSVTVKQLDGEESLFDSPITLMSVSPMFEYEGSADGRNLVTFTLDFETHVRLYGPISDAGLIHKVIVNFRDEDPDRLYETITVEAVDSSPTYEIITTVTEFMDA